MLKSFLAAAALVAGLFFTTGAQAQSSTPGTTVSVWCGTYACYYTYYTWNPATGRWEVSGTRVVYFPNPEVIEQ